jgi:WD40 repeat protein
MRVNEAGGTPQRVTTVDPKDPDTFQTRPHLLPGGQSLLFTNRVGGDYKIVLLDLRTGAQRVLANGWDGRYVPTGHLVYARGETLFAVRFDLRRQTVAGLETPVVEGLNFGDYAISNNGLLVYRAGTGASDLRSPSTLQWMDRKGVAQPVNLPPRRWFSFRISPDGRRVATAIFGEEGDKKPDIWIGDPERGTLTRLTNDESSDRPVWTPDGQRVVYGSVQGSHYRIYSVPVDGGGKPELLLDSDTWAYPDSWTTDGKTLLFDQDGPDKKTSIKFLTMGADGKPVVHSEYAFQGNSAKVSPDGQWVAYYAEEGTAEVYIRQFPGPGGRVQISAQTGRVPRWGRNGRELFYEENRAPGRLMAVDIPPGSRVQPGLPHVLFELGGVGMGWDVSPDGTRFLVNNLARPARATGSTMRGVVNWFEELRRRVPAGK